jgi:hypothetical protein
LGSRPGINGLILATETPDESAQLSAWFSSIWNALPTSPEAKNALLATLRDLYQPKSPAQVYFLTLYHLFKDMGEELDEDRIVKSATGIRNTIVWKKLLKFQRDGVVGGIDKLERLGGCIVADSVGLVVRGTPYSIPEAA